MAKAQEKQAFINSSPLKEHKEEGIEMENYEEVVSGSGCGCFRFFCFQEQQVRGVERWCFPQQKGEHKETTWLMKKLKKIKEFSEVLAGPKWKNFIRKCGKYCSDKKWVRKSDGLQYDPQSYALNFDDGDQEQDGLLLHFPSSYSPQDAPFSGGKSRDIL